MNTKLKPYIVKGIIMLKRTKIFSAVTMIFYLSLITWGAFAGIEAYQGILPSGSRVSDVSINLFFSLQPKGVNENIIAAVIMMALAPVLGSGLFIYLKNNNMFSAVQQRIDYKSFLKKGVVTTFFGAMSVSLITNLYQIGLINWFYYPFVFKTIPRKLAQGYRPGYFSPNELFDLILYIILAAIGWGVFAVLVFSVGLFVRKNALYLILGPVLGLALVLLAVLGNMNSLIWRTFAFSWFFYTLTAPGQYTFAGQLPPINSLVAFFIAAIIYLVIAASLIKIWYRRKRKQG